MVWFVDVGSVQRANLLSRDFCAHWRLVEDLLSTASSSRSQQPSEHRTSLTALIWIAAPVKEGGEPVWGAGGDNCGFAGHLVHHGPKTPVREGQGVSCTFNAFALLSRVLSFSLVCFLSTFCQQGLQSMPGFPLLLISGGRQRNQCISITPQSATVFICDWRYSCSIKMWCLTMVPGGHKLRSIPFDNIFFGVPNLCQN